MKMMIKFGGLLALRLQLDKKRQIIETSARYIRVERIRFMGRGLASLRKACLYFGSNVFRDSGFRRTGERVFATAAYLDTPARGVESRQRVNFDVD